MSAESWDESWFFDIDNLEDFDDEVDKSDFEEILEEFPNAANLPDMVTIKQHWPIITGIDCPSNNNFISKKDIATTDSNDLPNPMPFSDDHFTVYDYLSDEYASAETLNEAIKMRGKKRFLKLSLQKTLHLTLKKLQSSVLVNFGFNQLGISQKKTAEISRKNSLSLV